MKTKSVTKNIGLSVKTDRISEAGVITADGVLHIPMDRLNACFAEHKGERVIAKFYFAVPGSTEAQRAYYYNYVVPTIQQAFRETGERKTESNVDHFLIDEYPGDKSESQIGLGVDVTEARHLNQSQMSDFLEWLKQYAAENLSVYVEDPRTI